MPDCSVLRAGDPATANVVREHNHSGTAASCEADPRSPAPIPTVPASGSPSGNRPITILPAHRVAAEKVVRSFNTWAFKREQPADPQLMLQIVAEAISLGAPVSFVLYWGKGPRCTLAAPDVQCLQFLAALAGRVRAAYAPGAAVKLIFTDTHAQLNGHSPDLMGAYFAEVEVAAVSTVSSAAG